MIFPNFTGLKTKIVDIQKRIGENCYNICVVLTILRKYAWDDNFIKQ